jgi:hypothetical protein
VVEYLRVFDHVGFFFRSSLYARHIQWACSTRSEELAIGYVMGLVWDSIKDSLPQLASQIDGVMNDVTTKLGGASPANRGPSVPLIH